MDPAKRHERVEVLTRRQRMQTDPPAGVSASPVADNVMTWYVEGDSIAYETTYLP